MLYGEQIRQCIIIGGGPAGTGPLVYAAGVGRLDAALARGMTIVETSDGLCRGSVGRYAVNSNTPGDLFVKCLRRQHSRDALPRAWRSVARSRIESGGGGVVPLATVGELLEEIGRDIESAVSEHPAGEIFLGHEAKEIKVLRDGVLEVCMQRLRGGGPVRKLRTKNVIVATGATPYVCASLRDTLARMCSSPEGAVLTISSDELLTEAGFARAADWLRAFKAPQVVIVGGRTGAFSAAWLLLHRRETGHLGEAGVWILHRSPIKVQYDSVAEAVADGFLEFDSDDVCEQSGKVFRIAGLRGDSKALYLALSTPSESRARLRTRRLTDAMQGDQGELAWSRVRLIVFATGYRTLEIPFTNSSGDAIPLLGTRTGKYVDASARVLAADGSRVPGAYAIGLGSGYLPREGGFGGEPSFRGRDNSIFLCQSGLGRLLLDAIVGRPR